MKKLIALALAVVMVLSLGACSVQKAETPAPTAAPAPAATEAAAPAATEAAAAPVEISLWTYPIGNWGKQEVVDQLLAEFNAAYPNITVKVEYLTYTDGDDKVNTAIEGNAAPDIVMEGPERLVANWGAKGKMVDLADLWTADAKADIYASVEAACNNGSGAYYEYPLCMTAHCMAINKTVFEETGAWQYVDAETHTWATENFLKAVETLYNAGYKNVGAVFCSAQGGDQGTRALYNNMYGGTFTNAEHTEYTMNSPENVKALETLYAQDGINFDASINGGEEADLFAQGVLQMAFCWNAATHAARTEVIGENFEVFPMAFPSPNGTDTKLCGGIWGFGIFDNGDAAKIDAAKTFIKWVCDENTVESVTTSGFWSVRQSVTDLYTDDALKNVYGTFMQYMGDYYNVIPGWTEARAAAWNMLQQIGTGTPVQEAADAFVATANAAAGK